MIFRKIKMKLFVLHIPIPMYRYLNVKGEKKNV